MPTDDYMASDEDVAGVPNGREGTTRYRTKGKGSAGAAPEAANPGAKGTRQGGVPVATTLGNLPTTVGKGEFERPIMEAVLPGVRDLAMGVADLKGTIYHAWEGPPEWEYATKGMKDRKHYSDQCRAFKSMHQWDPAPSKPVHRDLKIALGTAKGHR